MRKDLLRQQQTCLFNEKIVSKLKGFIARKIDNPQDIEEILQETLISAVYAYPTFQKKSSFFTWLCAIANHEISDFYRKKKIKTFLFSHLPWLEDLVSEALGPEQQYLKTEIEKEIERKVKVTLLKLSEGYSEILRLKYYQGLTVNEIAQRLNETAKTVESRLFRARKAFAQAFSSDSS